MFLNSYTKVQIISVYTKFVNLVYIFRYIPIKYLRFHYISVYTIKLCYKFEKRAIQFGTKIAHQTNIHKYGSNNKANGKAQFDEIK